MNSCRKGKVNELAWAAILTAAGFDARRGQQFSGSPDSPDVVCHALPVHFEVKAVEKLNVHDAIAQAKKDCPQGKWRAVAHKRNRSGWLVTMPAEDWLGLAKEWKDRS